MIPEECVRETNDSKITLDDQRSVSAIFLNPDRVTHRRIKLDGCVLKNETACDYILEKPGVGRIAVELKGSDVRHALVQVEKGIEFMKANGMSDLKLAALIVCTKYYRHPSFTNTIQKAKNKLARDHRANLHIRKCGKDLKFDSLLNSAS